MTPVAQLPSEMFIVAHYIGPVLGVTHYKSNSLTVTNYFLL